jgi:hypothetical protein
MPKAQASQKSYPDDCDSPPNMKILFLQNIAVGVKRFSGFKFELA